jgi:hypothetical protein
MKLKFPRQNFEKCSNFMKIRLVGAKADITKLTVAFRNFANAPKNATISAPSQQTNKLEMNTLESSAIKNRPT